MKKTEGQRREDRRKAAMFMDISGNKKSFKKDVVVRSVK